jgi:hypothetical protein
MKHEDLLKTIISRVHTECDTKDDVLRMLKAELISIESNKTLTLVTNISKKEEEFYLSPASRDDYWRKALSPESSMGIDIMAYKSKVMIWNDTVSSRDKKKKRTPRGWVSTARQFMANDKSKGTLLMLDGNKAVFDYLKL